jgi:hypothetical protein
MPTILLVATGVTLNAGKTWAIQIDGLITLTPDGSFNGNALVIKNADDVELPRTASFLISARTCTEQAIAQLNLPHTIRSCRLSLQL